MQQNSKCRLCGDRDETINHIINECCKLAQKEYKTRYVWVGKVIRWEMCKKLKFDHTNKWYMHNPATVLENDTHKLLWGIDIQIDHLILARRPYQIIINKKENLKNCRLSCSDWPNWKNVKRRISTLILLGNWKSMYHEGDNYTNCNWCFWYSN